ncbi:hypothetical protein [Bacillus sp. 1P02SD]|uniref:hypothetical protein n=1 Tax=Bacillus sp. 1P02SD TaxID=3132264 RepID=UPI00399F7F6B
MKIFDLQEVQDMEQEELLEETIKSIFNTKPINLLLKEMDELVCKMPVKADFEKIKEYIEFQNKEEVFEVIVPIFDERKLPEFQVRLFRKDVNDCFPERGYFISGNSKLIVNPLGLIKIEMNGLPITRVGSDFRFTRPSYDTKEKGYREYLYFYFDYDTKQYINVYSDKLEECKRKMTLNPKAVKDYHETVQEYIKREALLDKIIKRIYPLSLSYLRRLEKWSKGKYGNGGLTIGSVTTYLNEYQKFITQDMVKNLKIKLIYSNVTVREYKELIEKKARLEGLIQTAIDGLEEIKSIYSLTEENSNSYVLNINSFFEREKEITKQIEDEIIPELERFKGVRPTEFPSLGLNKMKVLTGYVGYDLDTNEVFPTIMQLQRRTSLTKEKEDLRSEEEYISNLISYLKVLEKQQE